MNTHNLPYATPNKIAANIKRNNSITCNSLIEEIVLLAVTNKEENKLKVDDLKNYFEYIKKNNKKDNIILFLLNLKKYINGINK